MLKIGISGAHGTGKTRTAVNLVSGFKNANPTLDIELITGTARGIKEPLNKDASLVTQQKIFATHLLKELSATTDIVICDRTLLDSFAYATFLGHHGWVKYQESFIESWMRSYKKLIWVRPCGDIAGDGTRDADLKYQTDIDKLFEGYFKFNSANMIQSFGYDKDVIQRIINEYV